MSASPLIRAFVAIPLPSELKTVIGERQQQLQTIIRRQSVRWTHPDQLHLTLKFYGNVASEGIIALTQALRVSCQTIPRFSLSLDGLGCFPSTRRPAVIWLGIYGDIPMLAELHKNIDDQTKNFGSRADARDFHPHLTIGRVKASPREARPVSDAMQNHHFGELGKWEVRELALIQSILSAQSSIYQSLAVFPLTGKI